MRFVASAAWLCAAVLASNAAAYPSDQSPLKAALEVRYAAMKSAMAAQDAPAISAVLAPNFVSIDVSGNVETAKQMITEIGTLKPDPNKTSTTTLISVAQIGDTAIVEQHYEMQTVKSGADGAPHKVVVVTSSTDNWVKRQGVWLLSKTVTNELSYSLDGAVVAHKVRQ